MIPRRVRLSGFLSYKDEQEVAFDGGGEPGEGKPGRALQAASLLIRSIPKIGSVTGIRRGFHRRLSATTVWSCCFSCGS